MAEFFSRLTTVSGCIPLGSFNAMFNFTGSQHIYAAATKSLAVVGCFISLFMVKLTKSELELKGRSQTGAVDLHQIRRGTISSRVLRQPQTLNGRGIKNAKV